MKAIVVFHGFGHSAFGRLFGRAGFRHCFVCVQHQGTWLRFDPNNGVPSIEVICADSFDLAAFYRAAGLTVVTVEHEAKKPLHPVMLGTSVGMAKRLIGVRKPFVVTPHQLHRYLARAA